MEKKKKRVRPSLLLQNEKANNVWSCSGVHSLKFLFCLEGSELDGSFVHRTHVFRKGHKDNVSSVVRGMELLL